VEGIPRIFYEEHEAGKEEDYPHHIGQQLQNNNNIIIINTKWMVSNRPDILAAEYCVINPCEPKEILA
jgi:hypothetical protein